MIFWVIFSYFVTWIFCSYIFIIVFWKLYSSKIITFKSFFWGILSYFVTWIFSSYIFTKIFWKIYENKNILFMWFFFLLIWSYFVYWIFCPYIFTNFFEKFWKQKILYLGNFLSNLKLICYSDFPFLYIHKKFLKNLWK